MGELGLMGICVPEGVGGQRRRCRGPTPWAVEEVSRGCASHGVIMSVNNSLYCAPVWGARNRRAEAPASLAPFRLRRQARLLLIDGAGRPGRTPPNQHTRGPSARARTYVLKRPGRSSSPMGREAHAALVFAQTDPDRAHQGISAFLVEKGDARLHGGQDGREARDPGLGHR